MQNHVWTPFPQDLLVADDVERFVLRLPSIPEGSEVIERAVAHILDRAREWGFTGKMRFSLQMGCTEAIANAMIHGNRRNPDLEAVVRVQIDDSEFRVTVEDRGGGFDFVSWKGPSDMIEVAQAESGRGLYLMRLYMTEVSFQGCGNCVRMVLRKPLQQREVA